MRLHGKDGQIYDQETGKTVAIMTDSDQLWLQEILAKAPEMYRLLKRISERGTVEVWEIDNLLCDIPEVCDHSYFDTDNDGHSKCRYCGEGE